MIDSYEFGKITIMGEDYDFDVFIIDSEVRPWIRDKHHKVTLKDLEDNVKEKCDILVLGTGDQGNVEVDKSIERYCKENNVQLIVERTITAVDNFNDLAHSGKRICGGFHLTC